MALRLQAQHQMKALGVEDGLSQGFVTSMTQDKQGFMWFGTYDGLNRYDGYTVRRYSSKPFDPWALQSSFITKIYADDRELLWVGTHHGLYVFDPLTERFFKLSQPDCPLPANPVDRIFIDQSGTVFVQFPSENNAAGIFALRLPPDFTLHLRQKAPSIKSIEVEQVKISPECKLPCNLFFCLGDTLPLVVDQMERIFRYSQANRMFQPFDFKNLPASETDEHNFLKSKYLIFNFRRRLPDGRDTVYPSVKWYPLAPLPDGSLGIWIYPHGPFFRKNDHAPIEFDLSREKAEILSDPAFNRAFSPLVESSELWNNITLMDRRGTIWVGTGGLGIRKIPPRQHAFGNLLSGKSISSLHELPNGQIWVRLYSEESLVINPITGQKVPAPWGFDTWLNEAFADSQGKYWLIEANFPPYSGKRLLRYDQDRRELVRVPVVLPFINGVPEKIVEDKAGNIWIAANQGMLLRFRKGSTEMERFSYAQLAGDEPAGLRITAIAEANNGEFWIGTNRGILCMDQANSPTPRFSFFKHDDKNPQSLSIDWVTSICQDPTNSNILWLGTRGGGLNGLNLSGKTFSFISETPNGLPDNVVYGILPGINGDLWCSTNRGICRFNPLKNTFVTYQESDGLLSTEFNANSYLCTRDGRLWFGGVNGLNVFRPEETFANSLPPKVAITAIKVRGAVRLPDTEGSLTLSFEENNVLFEFATLDFANPTTNRFRHRLKGIDKDWVYDGTIHSANYAALPPGEYVLEIEGATSDSPWSEQAVVFHLCIRSPWYKSWLAYFIYCFTLGAAIWGIIRYREKMFRLESIAEINQLESQRLKAFESVKNQFFANVAHELRTPLTVILGLANRLKRGAAAAEIESNAQKIVEQGNVLLNLSNQILDLAKLESQQLVLSLSNDNICQFISLHLKTLLPLAENKAIQLQIDHAQPVIWMDFDLAQIQKILNNLIVNAIRHSPQAGTIQISTTLEAETQQLKISIQDQGDGILPEDLPFVFERYYQGSQSGEKNGASGLGLTLSRDLVLLMGGEIKVESEPGKGAVFTILLPVRNQTPRLNGVWNPEHVIKQPRPTRKTPDTAKSPQLLIIEDNPALADFLSLCLRDHFRLETAADGEQGIQKALELIPDLILTDVAMPKQDGYSVTSTLKNDPRTSHIPIVMLTAKVEHRDRQEGQRRGANAYLTKPFEAHELLQVLNNLLHLQAQWKRRYAQFTVEAQPWPESAVEEADLQVEDEFMQKLYAIFEQNFNDETFHLERLCRLMGMSSSQLDRKLKALSDKSPMQLLRSFKLQKAREMLLAEPKMSIKDVCFRTGFKSPSHFSRAFSEEFGVAPSGGRG